MTILMIILSIIAAIVVIVILYMQRPVFGKAPSGNRLERIRRSPNFRNGKFQNLHVTPQLTEGTSMSSVIWDYFFKKMPGRFPTDPLPSVKTNLLELPNDKDVLVWFGHSSYFIQVDGRKVLIDPVFSGSASPLPGGTKAFKGSDIYDIDDLPAIDYLVITHDHFDHLDYKTVKAIRNKVQHVVCGLGVGAHLERWGYRNDLITEMDWNESKELEAGFELNSFPGRHFSGRNFNRNTTLWMSFLLTTPGIKIYLGGDSGYDDHFAAIGKAHGPIDLAILENGQYDKRWRYIHMLPDEVLLAAKDLQAKNVLTLHSSKFALSTHPWKEPLSRVTSLHKDESFRILTPMIGEAVQLKSSNQGFKRWWEDIG